MTNGKNTNTIKAKANNNNSNNENKNKNNNNTNNGKAETTYITEDPDSYTVVVRGVADLYP